MPRRWPANSACRACWCRPGRASPMRSAASSPTCGTTSSTRSTSRSRCLDEARCAGDPRTAQRDQGVALIAKEAVRPDAHPLRPFRRHAVRRPDAHHQRAAALGRSVTRDELQSLFEKAYFARFKVSSCRRSAPISSISTRRSPACAPALDLSRLIDPGGRAATLDGALSETAPVWFDGGWLDTPVYAARKTAARRGHRRSGDPRADGRDHRARARRPRDVGCATAI